MNTQVLPYTIIKNTLLHPSVELIVQSQDQVELIEQLGIMRTKDESQRRDSMSMISDELEFMNKEFINKATQMIEKLGTISMAIPHMQSAVHSHSNAAIAAQGRLNRGVRNCDSQL